MADAKKLMPFILKWEGGFVNDPADRGGATNKGITIGTFRQFYGKDATVNDLKNITDDQWLHIFKTGFWNPWKADQIDSQSIADILVDWGWASGPKTAIKETQKILEVSADGIVGPATLKAINDSPPCLLFKKIKAARIVFVDNIVARDPSQSRFINGWKNRINDIEFKC